MGRNLAKAVTIVCAVLVLAAAVRVAQNPEQRPTTLVSRGTGIRPTCADITSGSTQVATFGEYVRYATIQNLSSVGLEIAVNADSVSRATCNAVVAAGATVSITCWMDRIAIKNIGGSTATPSGASSDVIISGYN